MPDNSLLQQAIALHRAGNLPEAQKLYQQILAENPNSSETLNALAAAFIELKNHESAITFSQRALKLDPTSQQATENLRIATSAQIEKFHLLGTTYKDIARMDDAVASLKRALELAPDRIQSYHNLLLLMVASSIPPEEQAETARQFGERFANHLLRTRPFINGKNPDRKLRIGYVSPNLCHHPVKYFIDFFAMHDRTQFEIFIYSNTYFADAITDQIKKTVDYWHDITNTDDEVADLIEKDKIDILIDMAGHTMHNNLMTFARKPAPVQATWLGYPATTGLTAMDYRITDIHAEPPGMTDHLYTEKPWRLPEIFCCYKGGENAPPPIDHPPFEDNGYITFGCFNNFAKVNETVLKTWAQILQRVPGSRIFFEIQNLTNRDYQMDIVQRLGQAGFQPQQVILKTAHHDNQYKLYNMIDIALDPFPCNGGTTSFDTLWMGVPFVTLAGGHFISRMGVSILTNAGLPELIASDIDQYVEIAAALANDRERLKKIRHGLREKVVAGPLMDQKSFVKNLEDSYRQMWHKWCAETQ